MDKILIFAGTSEGRRLAEHLLTLGLEVHVSVATEYGKEVLIETSALKVHKGRLTESQMEQLLKQENWYAVVDATHPYAKEVSRYIKEACRAVGEKYYRLLRPTYRGMDNSKVVYVETIQEAAEYLNAAQGNILLTTGSKELESYVKHIADMQRLYVRILPDGDNVSHCKELGLLGKQIICMQGPFDAKLNEALIKHVDAKFIVTKETGEPGGFPQKLEGARRAGATAVVVRKPREDEGYYFTELLRELGLLDRIDTTPQRVTLLGVGMGSKKGMTLEALEACQRADVIIGAKRMVEALAEFQKPIQDIYQPKEVAAFIEKNPQLKEIVVAFSGDVGFYSGAKKLLEELQGKNLELSLLCGISSVAYAAAGLGIPWQDMKLVSIHGRFQNIIGAIRCHERVFSLVGRTESIRMLSRMLIEYGFSQILMHVGYQLGYPEETYFTGKPQDFLEYEKEGLAVVILENSEAKQQVITHGLEDEAFLRGNAPMTKAEIRSISLSKLALKSQSVVYDIGAGTGSIGIECARMISQGRVYAIEKKQEALDLLQDNKQQLQAANLEIVPGEAPEVLKELPTPTHAFIGGSSGNMKEIIALLLEKNPQVRMVINAIALETVAEVVELIKEYEFTVTDMVQVSLGKAKIMGNYHMMMGQNPVYIFTLQQ